MTSELNTINDMGFVMVPVNLIASACSAISKKRDAPKTLSELRRYTVGDLSTTRATPSADTLAGLQRFSAVKRYGREEVIEKDENGEYVLHSEAAKIIAEKDDKISQLTEAGERLLTDIEAAEAELAQIKAQVPVAWLVKDGFGELGKSSRDKIHLGSLRPALWIGAIPLYAAPVSDSLKAKCDRYEYALERISKMDRSHGSWDTIAYDAVNIAGSALGSLTTRPS